jgi:hypothetical protein
MSSSRVVQAVAVGGGPLGEKLREPGHAMVGALVPDPCNSIAISNNRVSSPVQSNPIQSN